MSFIFSASVCVIRKVKRKLPSLLTRSLKVADSFESLNDYKLALELACFFCGLHFGRGVFLGST